jgi:hypothetical protein
MDPIRQAAWSDMWANSCDILHRVVVAPEVTYREVRIFSEDVETRVDCEVLDPRRATKAYRSIRSLYKDLGYGNQTGFDWKGVPVPSPGMRGFKRVYPAEEGDRLTEHDRIVPRRHGDGDD